MADECDEPERVVAGRAEEARRWLGKLAPEWWQARPEATNARRWRRWAEACRVELLTLGAEEDVAMMAWGFLVGGRLAHPEVVANTEQREDAVAALLALMARRRKEASPLHRRPGDLGWHKKVTGYERGDLGGGWRQIMDRVAADGRVRVEQMVAAGVPLERAVEVEQRRTRLMTLGAGHTGTV
jgi:hypothetical protein